MTQIILPFEGSVLDNNVLTERNLIIVLVLTNSLITQEKLDYWGDEIQI
jgi:hypothetical protein